MGKNSCFAAIALVYKTNAMVLIKFLIRIHWPASLRSNYSVTLQHTESAERDGNSNHWLLSAKKTYLFYKLGKWLKTLNSHDITAGIFRCIVRSLRIQPSEALLRK